MFLDLEITLKVRKVGTIFLLDKVQVLPAPYKWFETCITKISFGHILKFHYVMGLTKFHKRYTRLIHFFVG